MPIKPIIVKPENKARIEAALNKAQGKAKIRGIWSYDTVERIIEKAEMRIGEITKKDLEGTEIYFDFGQSFPRAYKYRPESTHLSLVFKNGHWLMADVYRATCENRSDHPDYRLHLSDSAKAAILRRYE